MEFPSQFNEHWALYPEVFNHYAKHYKTGAPMPDDLVEKIKKSGNFNEGYGLTELLAAAELDMQWHMLPPSAPLEDPDKFEQQALARTHLDLHEVPPQISFELLQPHLGRRVFRRLLCVLLDANAR